MPSPRTSISPAKRRGRTHQQPPVRGLDMGAVVGDKPRERAAGPARRRAAAPARAATCPNLRGPGSARRARPPAPPKRGSKAIDHAAPDPRFTRGARHHSVGSRTVKRAPSTRRLAAPRSRRHGGAVLGPQPAAVGLDDLLGDRQAKTRVLAEALVRPVGVEALENLIEGLRAGCRDRRRRRRSRSRRAACGRSRAPWSRAARTSARCRSGC